MKTSFLFLVISLALSVSAQTVEIPDPALQKAIRGALEKPDGDITAEDMESLTVLDASLRTTDSPITGFEGTEAATNFSSLNLKGDWNFEPSNIAAEDLLPLGRLSGLTTLNLSRNDLTDVSFLARLTSLTSLNLEDNQLTDFSFLEGLTSLTILDVVSNPITTLNVPVGRNIASLELRGFRKSNVRFYIPLTVKLVSDKVEVNWTQGILQSTDAIEGAWSDIDGATSPYQVEPAEP